MKLISLVGAFVITLALLFYGAGSVSIHRFRNVSKGVLWFISIGLFFDIIAIVCMVIGLRNTPFSYHAIWGVLALLTMLVNLILLLIVYKKSGLDASINKSLYLYSRFAYGWWLVAYITGFLLIILNH
jgi:hypothetical protein